MNGAGHTARTQTRNCAQGICGCGVLFESGERTKRKEQREKRKKKLEEKMRRREKNSWAGVGN